MNDLESPLHPHEPAIPPAFDDEGRCLVCGLIVERDQAALALRDARADLARLQAAVLEAANALYEADDMLLGASDVSTARRNTVHEWIAAARAALAVPVPGTETINE